MSRQSAVFFSSGIVDPVVGSKTYHIAYGEVETGVPMDQDEDC